METKFTEPILLAHILGVGEIKVVFLPFPMFAGGGEGRKHGILIGMKSLKYNSWEDLNAC